MRILTPQDLKDIQMIVRQAIENTHNMERLYKVSEVQKILSVGRPMVEILIKNGKLRIIPIGKGRNYRITEQSIKQYQSLVSKYSNPL